jgi:hypothetical protein
MNTPTTSATVAPQIQSTETEDFDPREWAVSYFFVVDDKKTPVSIVLRTSDEAISFREQCGIDGATIIQHTLFCRNESEMREITSRVFGDHKA